MPRALHGLRLLQLGPLYNNHLRRWSGYAVALGCQVSAAGHVRPGRRLVDLSDLAATVDVLPDELTYASVDAQSEWLSQVIGRVQPDLIHAHWLPRWGYLAVRCSGQIPVALTPWGSDVYLATGEERLRADDALLGADRVLACSRHMRAELVDRGVSRRRLAHVDWGVDVERFRPVSSAQRVRLRAELGLPGGPLILSMRAPTQLYNLDVVLAGFARLRARRPQATLAMIHGDAPLDAQLGSAIEKVGGVRLVGLVSHQAMPAYMQAADVGISIPSSDGSPNSVWEALACGLPMVLSDLPQVREKIGSLEAVQIVRPEPAAVAVALERLLVCDRGRGAAAARRWAQDIADERKHIAELGRVFASMWTGRTRTVPSGWRRASRQAVRTEPAAARARPPS